MSTSLGTIPEDFVDVYVWTGTGFARACRAPRPASDYTQGFCKDPSDGTIWFAQRNYSGNDAIVPTTLS